jgi:putative DNA primase/helicase
MRHGRQIIDPNVAAVRAAPYDIEKLMLAATNGACVCIDNADNVHPWLASALCRVSTGGGFGTRKLYTNDGEHLINVMKPCWITGITDLTEREDFLSRCIILRCPPLDASERRTDGAINSDFEKARPGILGAMLTAVSVGIRKLPSVDESNLPRMADWFKWIIAVEEGLGWAPEVFKTHFESSQEEINNIALDNPVADAIRKFVPRGTTYTGTSQDLLARLNSQIGGNPPADWPRAPHSLSAKLNRLKNDLAAVGVDVTQNRREWTIKA